MGAAALWSLACSSSGVILPQLASQPALPLAALAAAKGSAAHGKQSSSDASKGSGPFAQLVAHAVAGVAQSKTSITRLALQHAAKQISSGKATSIPEAQAGSDTPAQNNVLAQFLAAQSSAARGSHVSGKPVAQLKAKDENGGKSGKSSGDGQTVTQPAAPMGQTIAVCRLPSAPGIRQMTKSDGLLHQSSKGAHASGSDSASLKLPPRGTLRPECRNGAPSDSEVRSHSTGADAASADSNPQSGLNPKAVQKPEIQGQPPQHSADTSANAAGDSGEKPVAQPAAFLLPPDEAIAGKPSAAPPPAAAENPKAPQDPPRESQRNTTAGKATATHAAHERQGPSGTVLPALTQPAPAPASVLPLPPALQPANSGNRKAIAQPAAPSGVANLSTASAAQPAEPAPMPGEHLAFALSATPTPMGNGAASQPVPQPTMQAGSQPLTVFGAEGPKIADREPTPAPVPASSVPQQAFAIGAGAWQPAASFNAPDQSPAPAAPPQAAAPNVHEPDQPASQDPLRILRVQFTGDNNQKVDVRMGDSGGTLRVSVRSTDAGLTQTLQANLPELTARLGGQSFHTEVWLPQSANAGTGNAGTGNTGTGGGRPGGFSFTGGHPNGQGQAGDGQQHRQNHYQPEWIDDLQAHPRRTQMTRRS